MRISKLAKRGWIILFLVIAAFYLYGLGSFPFVGPDEPRYAEVAREMLARRDLITPTLGGLPWFEKPSLLYWLIMASYRVLGVSEYAGRFGSALCGLAAAAFVYWLGKRSAKAEADFEQSDPASLGRWSALLFLSSAGVIAFSRGASFDIVLTATLAGALGCFFVWHLDSANRKVGGTWTLAGCYFFIGLSLLAKGLVGIVIPLGVITVYLMLRREWPSRYLLRSLVWGIPILIATAGVWSGPMIRRHGMVFIDQFIIQHHFARYLTNKYHHPQPFYYYFITLIWMSFPWTVVLGAALISARRWNWQGNNPIDRLRVFTLAWIAVPLLLFSFSGSKLAGYILPVMPAVVLLIGDKLVGLFRSDRGEALIRSTGGLLASACAACAWYAVHAMDVPISYFVIGALPAVVVGMISVVYPRPVRRVVTGFALATLFAVAVGIRCYLPIARRESTRDLIAAARERGYGDVPVFFMLDGDKTAEFYAGGRLVYQPDGEPFRFDGARELGNAVREKGGVALVIIETVWERQLTDYAVLKSEKVGSNQTSTLFIVRVQ